jgi:hypothetical protein
MRRPTFLVLGELCGGRCLGRNADGSRHLIEAGLSWRDPALVSFQLADLGQQQEDRIRRCTKGVLRSLSRRRSSPSPRPPVCARTLTPSTRPIEHDTSPFPRLVLSVGHHHPEHCEPARRARRPMPRQGPGARAEMRCNPAARSRRRCVRAPERRVLLGPSARRRSVMPTTEISELGGRCLPISLERARTPSSTQSACHRRIADHRHRLDHRRTPRAGHDELCSAASGRTDSSPSTAGRSTGTARRHQAERRWRRAREVAHPVVIPRGSRQRPGSDPGERDCSTTSCSGSRT